MPRSPARRSTAAERYWAARLRSPQFRRALTGAVERELRVLARERVKDVVDADLVHTMIRELDTRLIDRAIAADLVIEGTRHMATRLEGHAESLLDLLDPRLVAEIGAALEAAVELTPRAEAFVAALMRKEFVRSLFTDLIFTALVSFHERVNPFFGALATRVLEEQIKGFIRLFMPMLQAQAIAFVIDRKHHRLVLEFARAVARQLLDVPVRSYAALAGSANERARQALFRKVVKNAALGALARDVALAAWDDLYAVVRNRRIGDVVAVEEHAGWLAARCVDMILPALLRPHARRFVAAEIAGAIAALR